MSERLYIAAHALQGILARGTYLSDRPQEVAHIAAVYAVRYADALLAELHKTSPAAAARTSATPPAETAARGQEVDVARLERALLHASSPCLESGALCAGCDEVAEVVAEIHMRQGGR